MRDAAQTACVEAKSRRIVRCQLVAVVIAFYFIGFAIFGVAHGDEFHAQADARDRRAQPRYLQKKRASAASDMFMWSTTVAMYYQTKFNGTNRWFGVDRRAPLPFVCQVPATNDTSPCPNEYWRRSRIGKCYRVVQRRAEYNTAAATCSSMTPGGHLATPRSKKEMFAVRATCGPVQMCWLGISSRDSKNWTYIDDGSQVTLDGWNRGEPGQETAASVGMFSTMLREPNAWRPLWYFAEYSTKLPSICEKYIQSDDCPESWLGPWDGSCYLVHFPLNSHAEAEASCAADNSHLVFIDSEDENQKVHELCGTFQSCWIGLRCGHDGSWFWLNGTAAGYKSWYDTSEADAASPGMGAFMSWDEDWWNRFALPARVYPTDDDISLHWNWRMAICIVLFAFVSFFVQLVARLIIRIAIIKQHKSLFGVAAGLNVVMASFLLAALLYSTVFTGAAYLSVPRLGSLITTIHFLLVLGNAMILLLVASQAIELQVMMKLQLAPIRVLGAEEYRVPVEKGESGIGNNGADEYANVVGVPLGNASFSGPVSKSVPSVPPIPAPAKGT